MTFRNFFATLMLIALAATAYATPPLPQDTTKGILDKGKIQIEMAKARTKFLERDVRGALTIYRNVLVSDPKNANAYFRAGECHNELKNYDLAIENLDKAVKIDPEVNAETDYVYGQAYHRLGKLDDALSHYETFSKTLKNERQRKEFSIDIMISQVKVAKNLMAKPVPAEVKVLGRGVNSRHPDYRPVISPDGKTLYFTARRPDTKGGGKSPFDNFYYEDIYTSSWDDATNNWGKAESLVGKVNTESWDAVNCISPDGEYLYLTQNISGYTKSSDLLYTKLGGSGKWGKPKLLPKPINSSYYDVSASITGDDEKIFFVSERPGEGMGRADIYVAERISRKEWGTPKTLGPTINTENDESSVYVHPSGKIIFFTSDGPESMGGKDIFKSEFRDGGWSKPENLGYPINSVGDDTHFNLTIDGKKAFITSHRENGMGEFDIYEIDLSEYPVLKPDMEFKTHGLVRGTVFNQDGQPVSAKVEFWVGSKKVDETNSDTKGNYELELPGNKRYEIRFIADGYQMARTEVELELKDRGDTEIAKDIILKK